MWALGWVGIGIVKAWVMVEGRDADTEGEVKEERERWKDIHDMSFRVDQKMDYSNLKKVAHDLDFC